MPLKQQAIQTWDRISGRTWRRLKRKHRIRLGIASGVLAFLVFVLLFLPSIGLRYGITEGLRSLGMADVKLQTAEVALFGGRVGLQKLDAVPPEGHGAALEAFQLEFAWRPLLSRRLLVQKMSASGIDIEVIRQSDGSFIISGLPVPTAAAPKEGEEKPEDTSTPWGVGIEEFNLTNSNLIYREGDVEIVFRLQKLGLTQLRSWEPKTPAKLDLQATLNGALIAITGEMLPFDERQSVSLNLNINELDLGRLAPLLKQKDIKSVRGLLIAKASIDAAVQWPDTVQARIEGDVGFDKVAADTVHGKASFDKLLLEGIIQAQGSEASFDSRLSIVNFAAEAQGNQVALADLLLEMKPLNANVASTTTFDWTGKLALGGVKARAADAEVSQQQLSWNGKIAGKAGAAVEARIDGALSLEGTDASSGDIKASIGKLMLQLVNLQALVPEKAGPQLSGDTKLAISLLKVALPDLAAEQDQIEWNGGVQADLGAAMSAKIDGRLALKGSRGELPGTKVEAADLTLDLKPLSYRLGNDNAAQVDWKGALDIGGVKATLETLAAQQAKLAFAGQAALALPPGGAPSGRVSGELKSSGSRVELADLNLWLEKRAATVKTDIELVAPADKQLAPVRVGGQIEVLGVTAGDSKSKVDLLSFERLALDNVALDPAGAVKIEQVRLSDLKALQRQVKGSDAGNYPWRVTFGDLRVTKIDRNAAGDTSIDRVSLDKLVARLTRLTDGFLGLDDLPGVESAPKQAAAAPPQKPAPAQKAAPKSAAKAAPAPASRGPASDMPRIAINRIELTGDNRVLFEDRTLKPTLRVEASPIKAMVSNLDSAAVGRPSPVSLDVGLGKFGSFKLTGSVQPFDPKLNLDLKAQVRELDLPPFSPYVSQAVGVHFLTGQLTADVTTKITDEVISGEGKLRIANLFLDDREGQANLISQEAGLPIDTALGLLRDGDDNIDLTIPLGGNIQDPQFDLSSTISKAIGGAVRGAAITTIKVIFPPALLISAVTSSGLAQPALKPLEFPPSAGEAQAPHKETLSVVADLMKQRPTLKVRVCGVATRRDWDAMQSNAATERKADEKAQRAEVQKDKDLRTPLPGADTKAPPKVEKPAEPVSAEPDTGALEDLARLRSGSVKHTLVSDYGIAAERLFECRPSVQLNAEAAPRVDLRL